MGIVIHVYDVASIDDEGHLMPISLQPSIRATIDATGAADQCHYLSRLFRSTALTANMHTNNNAC